MKVLIVNENPAINTIINQILSDDGHQAHIATKHDDAEAELDMFKPDVIIIEEKVGGNDSMAFIDKIDPASDVKIIMLTSGRNILPKDKPMIVGFIRKPFKSTEILEAVRGIRDGSKPQVSEADGPEGDKKTKKRHIFGKAEAPKEQEPAEADDDYTIRFGKSYIVYESVPKSVYTVTKQFIPQGGDVLVISFEREKTVKTLIGDERTRVLCVTPRAKISSNSEDIGKLGTVMARVMEFIDHSVRPVIVVDEFTKIIDVNGTNRALMFICQIFTGVNKNFSMVMSVKENQFTDKDKVLLSRYMERYDFELEETPKVE